MLCLGQGLAEAFPAWSNGQSPQQPYAGVPPVDLTQKLGYMVLDPLNNEDLAVAPNALRIYLPRADVQAGEGEIRLYEKGAESPLSVIEFADADRVTISPIDAETLDWLFWESGVFFTVRLDNTLNVDQAYSVSLDENCILAPAYGVGNSALDGEKGWSFTMSDAPGVVKLERSGADAPKVGDSVSVQVKLNGDAVSAMIFSDSERVLCDDEPLTESGVLTARYDQAGAARWGVALTDETGQILSAYYYDEEVLPQ